MVDGAPVRGIACDLLTALVDSWTLWERVAGDVERGRQWRQASLRLVTSSGAYRSYEEIVAEATAESGLPPGKTTELLQRWNELEPYADVRPALEALRKAGQRLAVVTNCSQRLAELAAGRVGVPWAAVVSAEQAGFYKPHPVPYRAGCRALGVEPAEVLFVAGSAHDVPGASAIGLRVYWANRRTAPAPDGVTPWRTESDLSALPGLVIR
ncbi:MAG TPA: HAD-IA family hydrolase [Methylomirabilota bacterium]|nr:HAD-IA family hydrolase [Methylomirabilota bacterium]